MRISVKNQKDWFAGLIFIAFAGGITHHAR